MPKTYTKHLPTSVYNLGSKAVSVSDFARDKLWRRMSPTMGRKAVEIPVFLVNEAQMDILYPPTYRKALSPNRVRERLSDMPQDFNINHLDWNDWEAYVKTVAVGVYVSSPPLPADPEVLEKSDGHEITPEAEGAYLNQGGPRIYICGERVANRAVRVGCSLDIALDKVYYHELGHAIMDTYKGPSAGDPYRTIWGRIIEECAANYIAYSRFSGMEARYVQKSITTQPAEYLGYLGLTRLQPFPLPMDSPGDWDLDDQRRHREMLRQFFEENPEPHRLYRQWRELIQEWSELMWRSQRGLIHEDWDHLHYIRRRWGVPHPSLFWGWGLSASDELDEKVERSTAFFNIRVWTRYKAKGAPRDPEYVTLLEEWALYLLRVGLA